MTAMHYIRTYLQGISDLNTVLGEYKIFQISFSRSKSYLANISSTYGYNPAIMMKGITTVR